MKEWSVRSSGELRISARLAVQQASNADRHVSSHWQLYKSTLRTGPDGTLVVHANGFRLPAPNLWRHRWLAALERRTFRHVVDRMPYFSTMWAAADALSRHLNTAPDLLAFHSACAAAVLAEHAPPPGPILMIGDGSGYTGALFTKVFRQPLVLIDLPEQLLVQSALHASLRNTVTALTPDRRADAPPVALAFSMACFQELTGTEIEAYFDLVRSRASAFYLISRTRKVLPAGEVADFASYPWRESDRILVDGSCPFYTHYLTWKGRMPFAGDVRHRLIAI